MLALVLNIAFPIGRAVMLLRRLLKAAAGTADDSIPTRIAIIRTNPINRVNLCVSNSPLLPYRNHQSGREISS
jgi:hypothetical protein